MFYVILILILIAQISSIPDISLNKFFDIHQVISNNVMKVCVGDFQIHFEYLFLSVDNKLPIDRYSFFFNWLPFIRNLRALSEYLVRTHFSSQRDH